MRLYPPYQRSCRRPSTAKSLDAIHLHAWYEWSRLRKEAPGQYESYVDLVPGEWTKIKIEVSGVKARLFVNDSTQPVLVINDLKHGDSEGAVALWIGLAWIIHEVSGQKTKDALKS